jgi:hypothetical protein
MVLREKIGKVESKEGKVGLKPWPVQTNLVSCDGFAIFSRRHPNQLHMSVENRGEIVELWNIDEKTRKGREYLEILGRSQNCEA